MAVINKMGYLVYCEECVKMGYQKVIGSVTDNGSMVITTHQKTFSETPKFREVRVFLREGGVVCEKHQTFGYVVKQGTVFAKVPSVKFDWVGFSTDDIIKKQQT